MNVQNYENSTEIVYIRFIDYLDLRKNLDTLYMLIVQIVKFEGQLCTLDVWILWICRKIECIGYVECTKLCKFNGKLSQKVSSLICKCHYMFYLQKN